MDLVVRVRLRESLSISVALLALTFGPVCAAGDLGQNSSEAPGPGSGPPMTVPVTSVGTLQPTFQWSGPTDPGVTYDFIVCLAEKEPHGFWIPTNTAYYRGGLKTLTHTLDKPLLPNTMYVWSVRTRMANKMSKWAAYSDSNPSLFRNGRHQYNILCPFKTPAK
jgi:hypothetical protein